MRSNGTLFEVEEERPRTRQRCAVRAGLVLGGEQILGRQFSSIEEYLGRNTPAYHGVNGLPPPT